MIAERNNPENGSGPAAPGGDGTASFGPVEWCLGGVAGVMLFAIMAVTFVDVVGRYLLNAPVQGSSELIEVAMGVMIFSCVPLVTADRGHLTIGLFQNLIRGGSRRVADVVIGALSLAVVAVLTWQIWVLAGYMARTNEIFITLELPISPVAYFMSAMSGLSALILVVHLWRLVRGPAPVGS